MAVTGEQKNRWSRWSYRLREISRQQTITLCWSSLWRTQSRRRRGWAWAWVDTARDSARGRSGSSWWTSWGFVRIQRKIGPSSIWKHLLKRIKRNNCWQSSSMTRPSNLIRRRSRSSRRNPLSAVHWKSGTHQVWVTVNKATKWISTSIWCQILVLLVKHLKTRF